MEINSFPAGNQYSVFCIYLAWINNLYKCIVKMKKMYQAKEKKFSGTVPIFGSDLEIHSRTADF